MRTTLGKSLFLGIALIGAALVPATAQTGQKANVGKLEIDGLPSPEFQSGGKSKAFKPKDWMEAEADITIPALSAEQKKAGFIDQITVRWYVAVADPVNRGATIKLTKDVTHVNIPIDEAVFTSIYLSPNTLKRLTGAEKFTKGHIKSVGLEILVNGVKIAEASSSNTPGWWNSAALSDQSSKYPLLDKNDTPFKALWWDRYADIEEKK